MKKRPRVPGPFQCPRGDLNPHALIRALAPQASASANSATRTSAEGTLATGGPVPHIGSGARGCQDGGMSQRHASSPSYDPVLRPGRRGRRPVPRPDPDRHHATTATSPGRGSARRPSTSPTLLDEVGIESRAVRARAAAARRWSRSWGGTPGGEGALLLHGHLDVVPGGRRGLAGRPVLRARSRTATSGAAARST